MEITDEIKKTVGKALGRIPSGVHILTAGRGEQVMGMMASWVQQAGFVPPSVVVAVGKDRPIMERIRQDGVFALNVLGQADHALMKRFARGPVSGVTGFGGIGHRPGEKTGMLLLNDCLAWMECRVMQIAEVGSDHALVVAEVVAGALEKTGEPFVHLRGHGFHY